MTQSPGSINSVHFYDEESHRVVAGIAYMLAAFVAFLFFLFLASGLFFSGDVLTSLAATIRSEYKIGFTITKYVIYIFTTVLFLVSTYYLFGQAIISNKYKALFDDKKNYELHALERGLERGILKYNCLGFILITFCVILIAIFGTAIFHTFNLTIQQIKELSEPLSKSGYDAALISMIFILRTSLLGTFIIACVVYCFKLAKASFDQGIRFLKRKHATKFLRYLLNDDRFGEEDINTIMIAFEHWNSNIKSAFSDFSAETSEAPSPQSPFTPGSNSPSPNPSEK